jgi:ubiquinone/menaquinone biosynthesis C-methylase UbiE
MWHGTQAGRRRESGHLDGNAGGTKIDREMERQGDQATAPDRQGDRATGPAITAVFGGVAGAYAAARPAYPAELYERLEELAGRRLEGALVADVGAGTGIAARQLRDRGARVIAIDPSEGMLAELAASSPGIWAVLGNGNALPLRDRSVDFVTYAQAWHWVDPERAVPEFRRVLRPGGTFAAWWNLTDRREPWAAAQERRLRAACPTYHQARARYPNARGADEAALPYGTPMRTAEFQWSRRLPLAAHLANLNSKSYVAGLGPVGAAAVLETERAALLAEFPDGVVTERYRTMLEVVRT